MILEGAGLRSVRLSRAGLWVALFLAFSMACAPDPPAIPISGDASDGLVFVRRKGDSFDLHRARLSDGAVVPLRVTPEVEERWPYWSTGARRLLFQSFRFNYRHRHGHFQQCFLAAARRHHEWIQ